MAMTTDQLRAAAECLVTTYEAVPPDEPHHKAALGLARAYLAEHHADDGEPIDREWVFQNLRITVNGAEINEHLYLTYTRKKGWGLYAVGFNNEYGEAWDSFLVAGIKTRGELRRLCTALGIEFKEQA